MTDLVPDSPAFGANTQSSKYVHFKNLIDKFLAVCNIFVSYRLNFSWFTKIIRGWVAVAREKYSVSRPCGSLGRGVRPKNKQNNHIFTEEKTFGWYMPSQASLDLGPVAWTLVWAKHHLAGNPSSNISRLPTIGGFLVHLTCFQIFDGHQRVQVDITNEV